MDDAQQIVLVALQQAGIELPAETKVGQDLNSSALVSICGQAVNQLSGNGGSGSGVVTILPVGTAERFRACTDLAGAVKLLGYRGDLSFHQFLYPSPKDTHQLLRFLLDKLSKSSKGSQGVKVRKTRSTNVASTGNRMSAVVQGALTKAHGSKHTVEVTDYENVPFQTLPLRTSVVKTVQGVTQVKPTLVTMQAKPRKWLIPSLLELNAKNVINTRFPPAHSSVEDRVTGSGGYRDVTVTTHGEFLQHQLQSSGHFTDQVYLFDQSSHPLDSEDAAVGPDADTIAQLQGQLKELVSQADKMEVEARTMEGRVLVLKEEQEAKVLKLRDEAAETAALRDAVNFALRSSRSPSGALEELRAQVVATEEHLVVLQAEWEAVRRPLEEKKSELERGVVSGEGEVQEQILKVKDLQLQLKQSNEKLRARDEKAWILEAELKEIGTRPKRSSYVHRITELVKNSQKQETDIAKIISDTRDLQRDSNAANDRLRRTYALVDELVFRDAKKDPVCRQSYRQLITIHETFADIVDKVLEMDKTGRDIAELQAQLEELQKSSLDVKSVQIDLDTIAVETRALEKRLASFLSMQQNTLVST